MSVGTLELPDLDDYEVSPGVVLIGKPTPIEGTDKMRCLANYWGSLAVVELRIKFAAPAPTPKEPTGKIAHPLA